MCVEEVARVVLVVIVVLVGGRINNYKWCEEAITRPNSKDFTYERAEADFGKRLFHYYVQIFTRLLKF